MPKFLDDLGDWAEETLGPAAPVAKTMGDIFLPGFYPARKAMEAMDPGKMPDQFEQARGLVSGLGDTIRKKEQRQVALERKVEGTLGEVRAEEARLTAEMPQRLQAFSQSVDKQLATLLEESGVQADAARSQVGAQLAGRGLGRSTAAERAVGDVTLAEQEQAGVLREKAFQSVEAERRRGQKAIEGIRRRRQDVELRADLQRLAQVDQQLFQARQQKYQAELDIELAKANLTSQQRQFAKEAAGGFLGGIFQIAGKALGAG